MYGCYGINPMMQAYSYNMGALLAMNQIQNASFLSMPTFGAGDSVPFNMNYSLVGGCPFGMGMPFYNGGFVMGGLF